MTSIARQIPQFLRGSASSLLTRATIGRKSEAFSGPYKKLKHPFLCRLHDSAGFTTSSPFSLVTAGFASLWMGLFTLFRPTPLILYLLASKVKKLKTVIKDVAIITLFTWQAMIMFVLIFLGFLLTLSMKIKKRWVLILHSWGLILMYFDVAVWICTGLILHLEVIELNGTNIEVQYPYIYFAVVYAESVCFCLLHYVYATYFIAAELTIIENFF